MSLTLEQQLCLNINIYTPEEIAKKYTKKELAQTIVATTCWYESLNQQYKEFKDKESMALYIMEWLDDCMEDTGEVEDVIKFIDNHKDKSA